MTQIQQAPEQPIDNHPSKSRVLGWFFIAQGVFWLPWMASVFSFWGHDPKIYQFFFGINDYTYAILIAAVFWLLASVVFIIATTIRMIVYFKRGEKDSPLRLRKFLMYSWALGVFTNIYMFYNWHEPPDYNHYFYYDHLYKALIIHVVIAVLFFIVGLFWFFHDRKQTTNNKLILIAVGIVTLGLIARATIIRNEDFERVHQIHVDSINFYQTLDQAISEKDATKCYLLGEQRNIPTTDNSCLNTLIVRLKKDGQMESVCQSLRLAELTEQKKLGFCLSQ